MSGATCASRNPRYLTLTIYLLVAIGFKGGVALSEAGWQKVWAPSLAAVGLGALIPLWAYPVLRGLGHLPAVDAAALAAHYGSVSAVTFIAATNYLKQVQVPFPDYGSAFLAVMEAPAIVLGILLGRRAAANGGPMGPVLAQSLREAFTGRSVLLLVGALLIGWASGKRGAEATAGFLVTPFQGVLALFLLEMGMVAARRFGDLRRVGPFLVGFGILAPLLNGFLGVLAGRLAGLDTGGCMLLGTLASSASYIAAPAAMRLALPEANPTLYLTASLAVTFPFNLAAGLPIYLEIARRIVPAPLP